MTKALKITRAGKKPSNRSIGRVANQYTNTPKQNLFLSNYLEPTSPTFANAYQSAIQAGYKHYYAKQIASPSVHNDWLQEHTNKQEYKLQHILASVIKIADTSETDSKSPDDTRIKAIELIARLKGMLDTRSQVNVALVHPILGGSSVPNREILDVVT
jgi:hypothetical protein